MAALPVTAGTVVALAAGKGWLVAASVAVPLLFGYLALAVLTAALLQRRPVVLLGQDRIPDPHLPRDGQERPLTAGARRLSHPATGREVLHALLTLMLAPLDVLVLLAWLASPLLLAAPLLVDHGPLAAGPVTVTSPGQAWLVCMVGALLLAGGAYAVVALSVGHAALARALLGPRGEELHRQVRDLTRSRLRLVDAFDVERRRIERDLHDGAQQHLVALGLTLDLARIELDRTPHREALRLVEVAQAQAVQTLRELRELIAGVHPPVLTEFGLPGAADALADRSPLPVTVTVDLPGRLATAVETAAYFVLAEAVTNATKHSGAMTVSVDLRLDGHNLVLTVTDDGCGGADPARGSGLAGLGDRVAAVTGHLTLSSPPGGPTTVRAEIPLTVDRARIGQARG